MTTQKRPREKDPITRAFDQLDEDDKLIDEVLSMSPEALARDLGPDRVARAQQRAKETRLHYEALAAKLDATPEAKQAEPLTLTTPMNPIPAPSLRADASGPALPTLPQDSSARALSDVYAHDEPAPGSGQPHVARARAMEDVTDAEPRPSGRVIPLRRVLPVWLIAAAFAAAAVGGGAALGVFHKDTPAPVPTVPDQPYTAPVRDLPPDFRAAAATHRAEARALCDEGKWDECNLRLIKARNEDPVGDQTPEVNALWERILQHQIDEARKHPPDDDSKKGPGRP